MSNQELFLQLIGDEKDEAVAPLFMQHVLNRGMELIPDVIQTGIKKGQTLKAHIQNVMCFSYQLADILEISDSDKTDMTAACYVHDLNKFPEYDGQSYTSIATSENVLKIINKLLLESEYDFDLSIEKIVSIIRGHSGHYHVDGGGLFAKQQYESKDKLTAIIQAADVLDLSHHFHEKDQKEKALRILNGQIRDFQFEYTWHYFTDNRGIYTNLIHNSIADIYREKRAVPLLFYPEGIWYLVSKGSQVSVLPYDVVRQLNQEIDKMSLKDPSKSLSYAKVGFKFSQNPFELGLSADTIMDILVEAITNRKDKVYTDKYQAVNSESGKKCLKTYKTWMEKSNKRAADMKKAQTSLEKILNQHNLEMNFQENDERFQNLPANKKEKIQKGMLKYLQLKEEVDLENRFVSESFWESEPQNLFYCDPDVLRCGDLTGSFALLLGNHGGFDSDDAWGYAAEKAGIVTSRYPELRFFNTQSDRGFRIGAILHENGIDFDTVRQQYSEFINEIIKNQQGNGGQHTADPEFVEYIETNLMTCNSEIKISDSNFKKYIKSNHKQCCHCGGGVGIEWMAGNIPKGIKPQLFSNRLKGGGGEPKRNVCKICMQSFLVEKIVNERYQNHYYLHLFADGGEHSSHAEPGVFLESLKNGLTMLQSADCRSFFIQPGKIIKDYLDEKIPRIYGSPKKQWGMLVPKFSQCIGGQITVGINSPGENDSARFVFALSHLLIICNRFNLRGIMTKSSIPPLKADEFNKIFVDNIPLPFRALVPENNFDPEGTRRLWKHLSCVYGIRNTYDMIEDKEIGNIAETLYDKSGLELIYHVKKAYSKKERLKDYSPWKKAWPYLIPFIQEERLMPIKKLAEIALKNHFHGKTWKETSQAKPLDLAFDALAKHREPESEEDLKMVILHDVTRGLERLSSSGSLGKEKYAAVKEFVNTFFNQIFKQRYKSDKNKMIKDQKRIRAAFLAYLDVLRDNLTTEKQGGNND